MDPTEPMDARPPPTPEPAAPHRGGFLASALARRIVLGLLLAAAVATAVVVKIGREPLLAAATGLVRLVTEGPHRTERKVVSEATPNSFDPPHRPRA